jgi:hypothetical protein
MSTGIDACVLEDRVVTKSEAFKSVLDLYPYLIAPRFSESRLIVGGRLAENGDRSTSFLSFSALTPWGRCRQVTSANVLPALALIDGRMSGWEILEKLPKETHKIDESFLLKTLDRWRNAAQGEVLIDGALPVLAIAETLYSQRIATFDEAAVTRLLVRLRRSSIIAFRQEPAAG